MAKKTIRAGLVGAGFAARLHIEAIRRVYGCNVDVVGVHSRNPDSAAAFAARHGTTAFADLDALLGEVEVLHVLVPPALHEEIAVRALERNVFPIVEK